MTAGQFFAQLGVPFAAQGNSTKATMLWQIMSPECPRFHRKFNF